MLSNEDYIKAKYGFVIKHFLDRNKKLKISNEKKGIETKFDYSYEGISSSTGLRIASISLIVNGKSNIKATTLHMILESLNLSFSEFAKKFDKVTKEEVESFASKKG